MNDRPTLGIVILFIVTGLIICLLFFLAYWAILHHAVTSIHG